MSEVCVSLKDVSKSYDGQTMVLQKLNLEIQKGEFVVLIGKSGCGKTTLLKGINGMHRFDTGSVSVNGVDLNDTNLIALRRKIGYVIQQGGLFPHLSVEDNIAYVLSLIGTPKAQRQARAKEMIELVGLEASMLNKKVHQLSGGQQQRVGVARALASDPEVILMDEPFGAVDEITRRNLQEELHRLHRKLKKTIIFVTHDIEEAFKLGTRIILLDGGNIVLDGDKYTMLNQLDDGFAKAFFGVKNFSSFLSVCTVQEVMKITTQHHPISISKDTTLMEALAIMIAQQVDVLQVESETAECFAISFQDLYQIMQKT
ncbi:MAG: ATP-binding cassette domain-containing protein [Erysipelotrichaceae bacterium]